MRGGSAGIFEQFLSRGSEGGGDAGPGIWPQSNNAGTAFDSFQGGARAQKVRPLGP